MKPDKRSAWTVKAPGYPPFTMAGYPCTRDEAMQAARVIWPTAEIIE